MINRRVWCALVLAGAVSSAAAPATRESVAAGEQPAGEPLFESIAWMTGCWENRAEDRVVQEQWTAPLGDNMLGINRYVKDGRLRAYEFLRIEERDGRLVYIALPSGQKETEFAQAEIAGDTAVFENPDHDFPQRIRYRRGKDGSLLAQIEGEQGGAARRVEFHYRRVRCEEGVRRRMRGPVRGDRSPDPDEGGAPPSSSERSSDE